MRWLPLLMILGCAGSKDEDPTDTNTDTTDADPTDVSTDDSETTPEDGPGSVSGLGRIFDEVSGEEPDCELVTISTGERCPGVEGATTFMVVDARVTGEVIEGVFYKVFFSNQWWFEDDDWVNSPAGQAGQDWCQVVWDLSGEIFHEGNPEYCGFCEHEVIYNLRRDDRASDCPEALVLDQPGDFNEAGWDLDDRPDGGVVGFDSEREAFPTGRLSATGLFMWSDGVCEFYGSQEVGEGDCFPAE